MSYKIDSLTKILNKIDRGAQVTIDSLKQELEVTERTVHRYIATLKNSGYPIVYDKQKRSYSFTDNYCLRKPNISQDEQLALALAKKMLLKFDTGLHKHLDAIEKKLTSSADNVGAHIIIDSQVATSQNNDHICDIYRAIENNQKLEIVTKTRGKSEKDKANPCYIFFRDNVWYLRAYFHNDESMGAIPLNTIQSVKILEEYFIPKKGSPEEEVHSSFGAWLDDEEFEDVVLRFDPPIVDAVLKKKWHKNQEEIFLDDGRLELRFRTKGSIQMIQWIFQWIPWVEVVEPGGFNILFFIALHHALEEKFKYKIEKASFYE